MSEAGYGTVELLVPVLCPAAGARTRSHQYWITEQREATGFMVSPLGCLVQFTHSGDSGWARQDLTQPAWFRRRWLLMIVIKAA